MVVAAVEDAPSAASTRTRRTLMDDMAQEERRKAEGQQKKQEDASRAQSYRSGVDTFNAGMKELVTKVIDRYSRLLPPDDPTMEALRGTAFPDILTGASALAEDLSIADAEAARKHLKTQENFLQLKLNRSRAAGKVEMKNFTAEMEAAHARAIAEQAAALADGSVLKEIQEQLDKLTEEHNSLKNKYDRAEVTTKAVGKELKISVEKGSKLSEELAAVKKALADAMAVDPASAKATEGKPLHEQVGSHELEPERVHDCTAAQPGSWPTIAAMLHPSHHPLPPSNCSLLLLLRLSHSTHPSRLTLPSHLSRPSPTTSQVSYLAASYNQASSDYESTIDGLRARLAEATADAERAAAAHAEEVKRLTAGRQKSDREAELRAELESKQEQLGRVRARRRDPVDNPRPTEPPCPCACPYACRCACAYVHVHDSAGAQLHPITVRIKHSVPRATHAPLSPQP